MMLTRAKEIDEKYASMTEEEGREYILESQRRSKESLRESSSDDRYVYINGATYIDHGW